MADQINDDQRMTIEAAWKKLMYGLLLYIYIAHISKISNASLYTSIIGLWKQLFVERKLKKEKVGRKSKIFFIEKISRIKLAERKIGIRGHFSRGMLY